MTGPADTSYDPNANGVRDFTKPMEPHRFRIGDDVFAAPAILSPVVITRIAAQVVGMNDGGDGNPLANIGLLLGRVTAIFRALLPGASGELFAARLNSQGRPAGTVLTADDVLRATWIEDGKVVILSVEVGYELEHDEPVPIDLLSQAVPAMNYLLECYGLRPTAPSLPLPSGLTEATTGIPSDDTSSTVGA